MQDKQDRRPAFQWHRFINVVRALNPPAAKAANVANRNKPARFIASPVKPTTKPPTKP